MRLHDLVVAEQPMARLMEQKMSALTAYRLALIARQVEPHLEAFKKQRLEIARRFGEEKDGQVTVPKERMEEFLKELQPLLDEEVEIKFRPISPQDIDGQISPQDIYSLWWLFDNEGE